MFRTLIHPSSGACEYSVELPHWSYCGPCCRPQPATRIPLQPNHTETPTHIETRTYDQCGNSTEQSQAPDDGYINISETC